LLANASAAIVKATIVARQNTTGDTKAWTVDIFCRRGAAAANMEILSGTPVAMAGASAGAAAWTLGVDADTTNGCVRFTGTGEAAKLIKWAARCDVTHVVT
jgi:hypothetical protein